MLESYAVIAVIGLAAIASGAVNKVMHEPTAAAPVTPDQPEAVKNEVPRFKQTTIEPPMSVSQNSHVKDGPNTKSDAKDSEVPGVQNVVPESAKHEEAALDIAVSQPSDSSTKFNEPKVGENKAGAIKAEGGDQRQQDTIGLPGDLYTEGIPLNLTPSLDDDDSHVFILFTVGTLLFAMGYAIFHNKRKILALLIEGRHSHGEIRRGGGGINYKRVNMTDPGSNSETISVA